MSLSDSDNYRWIEELEKHLSELFFALRSRVLTADELAEVARLDYRILIRSGQIFREEELRRIFNEALLQQFRIRAIYETQLNKMEAKENHV